MNESIRWIEKHNKQFLMPQPDHPLAQIGMKLWVGHCHD